MNNEKFNNYDVFHAFLVENADFDGYIELPVIKTSDELPEKVVTFSKAMSKSWSDFDCWVVFYEHDKEFERLWSRSFANRNNSLWCCTQISGGDTS